jgi:2-polyprenyl-3-methyl-5-hydroxy-6-metoxy-1,4-benzoquinol methylase
MSDAVAWHSAVARRFAARYASSPAFREREAIWRELIERYGSQGGSVLDAGCGSGVMTIAAAVRAGEVLAFDASAVMLEIAQDAVNRRNLTHVQLIRGHIGDEAVLGGRSFDLILCSSVLEYVEDWWATFDWLAAALAPGGTLLFSMPNGDSPYRHAERRLFQLTGRPAYFTHVQAVPRMADVVQGMRQRGFAVEDSRFYAAAPLLSPLLRRFGMARFADTLFVIACRRM